jgi:superfamily II DNA or RNA helicase
LKESQVEMVNQWMKKKYGIIKAVARSGKTVIMAYIVQKLKQKTLIIANQRELLVQWKKEFSNVVTNCGTVATEKHPVVGIMKKWSDIDKYDIVLSTWQIWNRNPKKIHKYRNSFGLIFVDEIHRCNADCPKNVISQFNCRYKGGVTATVERKDGRQYYMDFIVGPVTASVETEQMKCKVCQVKTGLPIQMCMWTYYINRLCKSPERNKMIIKLAYRLSKQGRYIVIGSDRTNHIKMLTRRLKKIGVKAAAFYSGCKDRNDILDRAKQGKIQVFVANRSMLTGINVPIWDCFMNVLPINNEPTYYQQFSRIRTPMKGKPMPIIYDFVDDNGVSIGLFQKRCKQYKSEGFLFIPSINGDLKLDEAREEEKASLSHWQRRLGARKKAKPFFNGPTAHRDGVAVSSIFQ